MEIDELNEIFFSRLRLAIISNLIQKSLSFKNLKIATGTTDGNLSVQLKKLEKNNFVKSKKEIENGRVASIYSLTEFGKKEFERYLSQLQSIIEK